LSTGVSAALQRSDPSSSLRTKPARSSSIMTMYRSPSRR
jgi:hypothetical protein